MTLDFAVILVVGRDFSAIRENQRVYFSITVADVGYTRKPCCGKPHDAKFDTYRNL